MKRTISFVLTACMILQMLLFASPVAGAVGQNVLFVSPTGNDENDGSYYHQILYCQNKWIDYMVYPIYKEFNEDYKELLENQGDILIKETDTEWIFGNIQLLTPCVIPELD